MEFKFQRNQRTNKENISLSLQVLLILNTIKEERKFPNEIVKELKIEKSIKEQTIYTTLKKFEQNLCVDKVEHEGHFAYKLTSKGIELLSNKIAELERIRKLLKQGGNENYGK